MKKFLMPCGLCSAVPILKQAPPDGSNRPRPCSNDVEKKLIRPSELPIYTIDECTKSISCPRREDAEPSTLEQGFGTIRRSLMSVVSQYEIVTNTISSTIIKGKDHSAFLVDYLREDESPYPRIGAITVGGLLGFMLGIRGGKFKKLVYTSTGSLAVAAFVYPAQARSGFDFAKHYTSIGYNFIYGVKPGDLNKLEIHWPEMPTSLSEVGDLVIDVGLAATNAVGSLATKAIEAVKQKEAKPEEPTTKPKTS